jgi:hypothetical protein
MAKYLKSKKYRTKNIRKQNKKKQQKTEQKTERKTEQKKKTSKNRKNKLKRVAGGVIQEITSNQMETQFEQKEAIINYGSAPISTFNLVNCIAIGGIFKISESHGTFLTHESPTDYNELQNKLTNIKKKLDSNGATITSVVIFRINEPSKSVYANGLTTENIINLMSTFSKMLFSLEPNMITYSCNISEFSCGKAIISPTQYSTSLIPLRLTSPVSTSPRSSFVQRAYSKPRETFKVNVLYNKNKEKIYECPICKGRTGTSAPNNPEDTSLFAHNYNCPNTGKIPIEN